MALTWRAILYDVAQNAVIQRTQEITDIINDFTLERTVGDDLYIKSGDIALELLSPLKIKPTFAYHYLAIYLNGSLFDLFWVEHSDKIVHPGNVYWAYDSVDEKWGRYKLRLESIQKKLYEDLHNQAVTSTAALASASAVTIDTIQINDDVSSPSSATNRWGFSLIDIITFGQGGPGWAGGTVTHPGAVKNEDTLPILYRGLSDDVATVSDEDSFDNTFAAEDEISGETWTYFDLYKLASLINNSFIRVTPRIASNTITVDVDFIPKIAATVGTVKYPRWYDRTRQLQRFKVDGVEIKSAFSDFYNYPTFTYQQGNPDGDKVIRKTVKVASPAAFQKDVGIDKVYLSHGDFNSGDSQYEILNINAPFVYSPYFEDTPRGPGGGSGAVSAFYSDMIDEGHGYAGEIKYNGEKILDQVAIDEFTIQINRLKIKRSGQVKVEGIKLA